MNKLSIYHFIAGFLIAVTVSGCITTNPVITAIPTPSATIKPTSKPTLAQTSSPSLPPTATPISWPVIHGIGYSPYRDCQSPDTKAQPTIEDIKQDLNIIRGMANAIRTYSSTGINAEIPVVARQMGLRVSAGAWLSKDTKTNDLEIQGLIDIAHSVDVESVIVGNETLQRGDLTDEELIGYIDRVKKAVNVPVTTADTFNALLDHPKVMEAVDYEMVHIYPFWGGAQIDGAAQSVIDIYHNIQKQSNGKRVVIGETGWPSAGPPFYAAVPSLENQDQYAKEFLTLALASNVDFYYFDAFDEMYKTEGGVGSYWGLLYANRDFKSDVQSVEKSYNVTPRPSKYTPQPYVVTPQPSPAQAQGNFSNAGTPTPESPSNFYVYENFGSPDNHYAPGGLMGDISTISQNSCWMKGETWPKSIIQVSYTPDIDNQYGWAGEYWLEPDGNWGILPNAGENLSNYMQLVFKARAEKAGTQIKFFVGGVIQNNEPTPTPVPYPSSITKPIFAQEADPEDGFVNLSDSWQEYHIDLTKADLHSVIDGFGWAAERTRTPDGALFYLDDIHFIKTEPGPGVIPPIHIYSGKELRNGLDMGIDSSGHVYDWVENMDGQLKVSYPARQDWGSVFITVGQPAPYGSRESMDLSHYQRISLEMRSENENAIVYIGIKDKSQYDNGYETVLPANLSTDWKAYTFDLSDFKGAALKQIYIPIEFVFRGNNKADQTIYSRNIQYLP